MMSNNGLIIENMDLSHIYLAVMIQNIELRSNRFLSKNKQPEDQLTLVTLVKSGSVSLLAMF